MAQPSRIGKAAWRKNLDLGAQSRKFSCILGVLGPVNRVVIG